MQLRNAQCVIDHAYQSGQPAGCTHAHSYSGHRRTPPSKGNPLVASAGPKIYF